MDDIFIWQRDLWQKLTKRTELPGHALLLSGKKGIGKYHFARCLAKSLLCAAPTADRKDRRACGQCHSCGWFEQGSHPNFYAVLPEALAVEAAEAGQKDDQIEKNAETGPKKSASQQIGIDQIRKLNDFVYLSGHQEGHKIVLIYPAEAMNPAAANALLKKLEEPPEHVVFLLVAHQAQHLLPTIRSRCQTIAMPIPDVATSVAWLTQHNVPDPEANLAGASFSPLSALLFNEAQQAGYYAQFIQLISTTKRLDPVAIAAAMPQADLALTVTWLQQWCYDLISYRSTGKIRYFLNHLIAIKAVSARMDLHACLVYSRTLNSRRQLAHHPLNARLFMEELFIEYTAMIERK
ncbi:MAG: DNA polymerase III subunit delta' [Nitrosomonas sp.]|nr:DNA polymerase III subunit delta' [Nitrosomonas sp.]